MKAQFGMIGLGTMGRNLVLNIADHGFAACGYDRNEEQAQRLIAEAGSRPVTVATSSEDLLNQLQTPRIVMLLVPAGKVVDLIIEELLPNLEKGDILIDGGNSHYVDTQRRFDILKDSGVHFIGMGVSGGESGARFGPSMMPGGNKQSYEQVKEILEAIAARYNGEPCVAYMGNGAAGHYIKMVHNGIEYAIMQMISEVYGLLKKMGLSNEALHDLFSAWNEGELQSFLVEITARIFKTKDPETGNDLVDMILDRAQQKGTGLWTSQSALELSVPTPTIDVSVTQRYLSALKEDRVQLAPLYQHTYTPDVDLEVLKNDCKNALHFGCIMAYAQGLSLLAAASQAHQYAIDIPTVIKVWRAGCIIRSALLNQLYEAYEKDANLKTVIGSDLFVPLLTETRKGLVNFLESSMDVGLPAAALASALYYFDAYVQERLPANLIQAQRDYFGAHTYERIDQPGSFHTDWNV